jgi:glycosyltransferase involved in cell wall biosynthesis
MPFLLLMPSYNQSHYIGDAVRSVLAQDDPDWELWILDNSSDATPQLMRGFSDPRIRFHHIAERMDPGTCLNWMLERARGEMFSYLHTDNNLHPGYVRTLRQALSGRALGLAYCDMRVIDGAGQRVGVHRRGVFDLPRLLSLDPLGVPFAATTELARLVGGFSTRDVADDVRFCAAAYGRADFVYVREPIIEYRVHDGSRTHDAGGVSGMQNVFLGLFSRMLPEVEERGLRPREQLASATHERLDDLEWFVEDLWYRLLSRAMPAWWEGPFRIDHFFAAGFLALPRMQPGKGAPAWGMNLRNAAGRRVNPLRSAIVWLALRIRGRELRRLAERSVHVLLPWACMELGVKPGETVDIRIAGLDFRTVWAACQLQARLGWRPVLDASLPAPGWLQWGVAAGSEPLLDCSRRPRLTRS